MQTPATKHLIRKVTLFLHERRGSDRLKLLNIGAGRSLSIENQLMSNGFSFVCDRVDAENWPVAGEPFGQCYQCQVESMRPVESTAYDLAFANYLLEHIQNLPKAASEIYRILKPRGIFVAAIPNPTAPEFLLAKLTPLWFHKLIRGTRVWETYYAYQDLPSLSHIFERAGFDTVEISYWPCTLCYLERFVVLNRLAALYDKVVDKMKLKRFMGNVCITFRKL